MFIIYILMSYTNKASFSLNLISDKYFESPIESIEEKKELLESTNYGFIYAVTAMILWGVGGLYVKLLKEAYKGIYNDTTFIMYRGIFVAMISLSLIKYKKIKIFDVRTLKTPFWFFLRTFGSYFAFYFYIKSFDYLRLSTASCINTCYPIISALISIILLGEKFYMRYLYGLSLCLFSTILISANDKPSVKTPLPHQEFEIEQELETILGIIFGLIGVVLTGLSINAQKILATENIDSDNQALYVGISNFVCGILMMMIYGFLPFTFSYIIMTFIGGFLWYLATFLQVKALVILGVANATPLAYITTVSMFIFGIVIFGEAIYLTDVCASLIILAFNIYHTFNPLK